MQSYIAVRVTVETKGIGLLGGLFRHDSITSPHATHATSLNCRQQDSDLPLETMKRARIGSEWVCDETLERQHTRTSGGWSSPIPRVLPAEECTFYTSCVSV